MASTGTSSFLSVGLQYSGPAKKVKGRRFFFGPIGLVLSTLIREWSRALSTRAILHNFTQVELAEPTTCSGQRKDAVVTSQARAYQGTKGPLHAWPLAF